MLSSRFLLVSRVGRESLHREWLAPAQDRGFDVLISAYDRSVPEIDGEGVVFEYREGQKVAGYGEMFRHHADLFKCYDYIALFDDDLSIDAGHITRLFEIAAQYELKIAQPALDHASYFSYGCLLQHREYLLRYITYIEMMCPVFRSDVLERLIPLFEMGFESGIDLIWGALAHEQPTDFAVIDAVPILHSRKVGNKRAANGFGPGKGYEHDIRAILAHFGLPWLPCLAYGAVLSDGRPTQSRLRMALAAARLAWAIPKHRPIKWRLRPIAVYWKHLLQHRPHNLRVRWPERAVGSAAIADNPPPVMSLSLLAR